MASLPEGSHFVPVGMETASVSEIAAHNDALVAQAETDKMTIDTSAAPAEAAVSPYADGSGGGVLCDAHAQAVQNDDT